MSSFLSFALFFGIGLSVLALFHYYLWARLVRDAALPKRVHRALTGLLVVLYAAIPAALFLFRVLPPGALKPAFLSIFGWLGILLFAVTLLFGSELLRLLALGFRWLFRAKPMDPSRRITLSRLLAGTVALATLGLGTVATRAGLARVAVKRVRVGLSRLSPAMHDTSIVQLTDLHLGQMLGKDFVEQVVAQANALNPDIVAITGDLVDGDVELLREHVAPLARLKARYGVFFVTGNHEYYSGWRQWCDELRRLGIRVLQNERVTIGTDSDGFDLAGVNDFQAARFEDAEGPDLARALEGRDAARELVLLAHQPRAVYEAERMGVGLQLSGHTHGGQLWPWTWLIRLQQPVVSGLARIGRTLVYVSNGTGFWGPPMRLGAPAEITHITLEQNA